MTNSAENAKRLFCEGLVEGNTGKLLRVPKSDLHNHSTKGCRRSWLSERLKIKFPNPPERFDGLEGMQKWFTTYMKPFCSGKEGGLVRWEGAFAEAKRNNIKRLSMNFGAQEIELFGGMAEFRTIIEGLHSKHCPEALFEPELTYVSCCDVEDVRRAVEVLGLQEVHHGIHAAGSAEVMHFLAENRIQLNVCPSSNVQLGYASGFADHPIKALYENGVRVTINTDDLMIFDSSIENEYLLLYRAGALTANQLNEIRENGLESLP